MPDGRRDIWTSFQKSSSNLPGAKANGAAAKGGLNAKIEAPPAAFLIFRTFAGHSADCQPSVPEN